MKTTKLKDFKNMAFIPCFLFFPPTSLPFFYAFSFTVKKMADFCQKLLLQKHVLSHVWSPGKPPGESSERVCWGRAWKPDTCRNILLYK